MNEGKIRKGSNLNNTKVLEKTSVCWLETKNFIYILFYHQSYPARPRTYISPYIFLSQGRSKDRMNNRKTRRIG